jgi:hypothetical protein
MSNQVLVAGVALIAFGSFFLGYGLGWGQCNGWRDQLELETDEMERRTTLFYAVSGRARRENVRNDVAAAQMG